MAVQTCSVTVTDISGIRHTVEVSAESLFEAAAQAIAIFRKAPWMDEVGPATRLEVEVRNPSVRHAVTVMQIEKWVEAGRNAPAETVRRKKVADLLRREAPEPNGQRMRR